MQTVSLAILYSPENGTMPLVLSKITDRFLLRTALTNAISAAQSMARTTAPHSTYLARGYSEQAAVLQELLAGMIEDPSSAMVQ